jgi:ribosomal protein L40E
MSGNYCSSCGAELLGGASFCAKCGSEVQTTVSLCRSCGAEVTEGAAFCGNCGAPVTTEPPTGTKPGTVATHCSACGAALPVRASFCGSCGAPVWAGGPPPPRPAPGVVTARPPVEAEVPIHAARLDIPYPEQLSRGLIFVKWLLAIPHIVVLALYGIAVWVAAIVAWFTILFSGNQPRGLFDFIAGFDRWYLRVSAYVLLLTDEYPPFSNSPGEHSVEFEVDYPESLSRGLIFVKWLLVAPHLFVLVFYAIAIWAVSIIAWFAILFTATYPRALFDFVAGYFRWLARVAAYSGALGAWAAYNPYVGGLLTDEYPPFSNA